MNEWMNESFNNSIIHSFTRLLTVSCKFEGIKMKQFEEKI